MPVICGQYRWATGHGLTLVAKLDLGGVDIDLISRTRSHMHYKIMSTTLQTALEV